MLVPTGAVNTSERGISLIIRAENSLDPKMSVPLTV